MDLGQTSYLLESVYQDFNILVGWLILLIGKLNKLDQLKHSQVKKENGGGEKGRLFREKKRERGLNPGFRFYILKTFPSPSLAPI